jgi:hypothetical protein
VRWGEVGTVEMKPGRQLPKLEVALRREVLVERPAGDPVEQDAPTEPGDTRHSGMDISATIASVEESADVEICVTGDRIEPRQFDLSVAVGVVFVELDTKCGGTVRCVDPEDGVGEPAHQPQSDWFYRECP